MSEIKEIRNKIKSLHILLVDDEEKIREGTKNFMQKFFEDVDTAENGEVALKMFKNKKYDAVVTDIKMPKMSGWELIDILRDIDKDLFLVAITGSSEDKDKYTHKLDLFLQKPVNIDSLIKMMKILIEHRGL